MKSVIKISFLCGIIVFMAFSCEKDDVDDKNFHVKDFSYDGCKSTSNKSSINEYIEYKTVDENYLSVKHVNALFNCCPGKLTVDAKIDSAKLIIITEDEEKHACDCMCRYDLDFKIGPLDYGEYQFIVKSLYLTDTEFTLYFSSSTDTTHYIDKK